VRPTLSEQLAGVARILAQIVAPAIHDPYPADVLGGLIATLDAIAASWTDIPAYLAWDAAEMVAVLSALGDGLDADRRGALAALADDVGGDPFDIQALEDRHRALLTLLADTVAAGLPPEDAHRVAVHLRERAARYPVVATQRMPGQH
jgi:hypothetical protein